MPTQTFFRLPAEKRERLTEAAWEEFTRVRLAEASINRIIHSAQIPRGSFYQYFEDKEDLFFYLLDTMYEECLILAGEVLTEARGDLFAAVPLVFDRLFGGELHEKLAREMELLRLNNTLDMSQILVERAQPGPKLQDLLRQADASGFRRTDEAFFREVVELLIFNLMYAMRDMLCGGDFAAERARLCSRVDIVRRGSLREERIS